MSVALTICPSSFPETIPHLHSELRGIEALLPGLWQLMVLPYRQPTWTLQAFSPTSVLSLE